MEDTINWNKILDEDAVPEYQHVTDSANAITIDLNGYVYVAGEGKNLTSDISGLDWWIKKYDSSGIENTEDWNLMIDGNSGDDSITAAAIDSSNNLYVAGYGTDLASDSSGNHGHLST